MKTIHAIITLSVYTFCAPFLQAAVVITDANVSQVDFWNTFDTERLWYAQLQPGGAGETHPRNEFELGDDTILRYYEGNTTIIDEADNQFSVTIDGANSLSVMFAGSDTPVGNHLGVTNAYNTIWIGFYLFENNGFEETLDLNNHQIDGLSLPNYSLVDETSLGVFGWQAFRFYLDDQVSNIGDMTISGNIHPDMFFGAAIEEGWTYTVFGTYDPTIVPEPSSFALIMGGMFLAITVARRR